MFRKKEKLLGLSWHLSLGSYNEGAYRKYKERIKYEEISVRLYSTRDAVRKLHLENALNRAAKTRFSKLNFLNVFIT